MEATLNKNLPKQSEMHIPNFQFIPTVDVNVVIDSIIEGKSEVKSSEGFKLLTIEDLEGLSTTLENYKDDLNKYFISKGLTYGQVPIPRSDGSTSRGIVLAKDIRGDKLVLFRSQVDGSLCKKIVYTEDSIPSNFNLITFVHNDKYKESSKFWNIEVNIKDSFIFPEKIEGDRTFVVVKIVDQNGAERFQTFYKSTGKNSNYPGLWFPCDGVSGEGWRENIEKSGYENRRTQGFFIRMGSPEFVRENGLLYPAISQQLLKMNIQPQRKIKYNQINDALRSLGVKLNKIENQKFPEGY